MSLVENKSFHMAHPLYTVYWSEEGGAQPPPLRDRFARACTGADPETFGPVCGGDGVGHTARGGGARNTKKHKKRCTRIRRI